MDGFSNPSAIHGDGRVEYQSDSKKWVEFYAKELHDPMRSQEEGRPVFKTVDFVRIREPGEKDEFHGAATDEFQMRFARQWELYKAKKDQTVSGTPLSVLFPVDPGMVKNFEAKKIFTVEQMAKLTEQAIAALGMGGRQHVQRAKDYLATASKGVLFHEYEAERSRMRSEIDTLKAQIAALVAESAKKAA